jgi:hypothetical protein
MLKVLPSVLYGLRAAGMTAEEVLGACREVLEADEYVFGDPTGHPPWAMGGFEDDTRVARIAR